MCTARVLRSRAWRLRPLVPLAAFVAFIGVLSLLFLQTAQGDATCDQYGATAVDGGRYVVQNNEWNSNSPQCVTSSGGTGWTVTSGDQNAGTDGPPAAYPSIFRGCHWGRCTTSSGLPIQVSDLGSARSSWSTRPSAKGVYDTAYDIWFNTTPSTSGQPNGAELMIWLNSRGHVQPAGSMVGTATTDGAAWNVWTARLNGWNYVAYVRTQPTSTATGLDVKAFTQDAVARGSIDRSWYLIGAEAGFEIWQGGQGLTTNSFSFDAANTQLAAYRRRRSRARGCNPSGSRKCHRRADDNHAVVGQHAPDALLRPRLRQPLRTG